VTQNLQLAEVVPIMKY